MLDLTKERHAHIDARLRSGIMIWLGTVRPNGKPHFVPVWFLWDGEYFFVYSKPDQKIRNLKQNSSVIIALDDTKEGNDPIAFEGEATLLPREEALYEQPDYVAKYQPRLDHYGWTARSMAAEYSEPIKIRPTKLF